MKLNENFSDLLRRLKKHIYSNPVHFEYAKIGVSGECTHISSVKTFRFYAEMFQLTETDFEAFHRIAKEAKQEKSSSVKGVIELADEYRKTDFSSEEKSNNFLIHHTNLITDYTSFSALNFPSIFASTLCYGRQTANRLKFSNLVKDEWGEDLSKLTKVREGIDFLSNYWSAERFTRLVAKKSINSYLALFQTETADEVVEVLNQFFPDEEEN